jgi:hypothetical protein
LYQLNDHRIAAAWGVVKALIAKVCYKCTYWKKVKGSCRAAAWASAWQGGGSIDERFVLFAQSDGTNHAEELLLQQIVATYASPNFDHMYVDISPCTGKWSGHHCMDLLLNGSPGNPAPSGTVWFAMSEQEYQKG